MAVKQMSADRNVGLKRIATMRPQIRYTWREVTFFATPDCSNSVCVAGPVKRSRAHKTTAHGALHGVSIVWHPPEF